MAANDKHIKMTVRLERDLYLVLRDYCRDLGNVPHNRIIVRAVKVFLTEERLRQARRLG